MKTMATSDQNGRLSFSWHGFSMLDMRWNLNFGERTPKYTDMCKLKTFSDNNCYFCIKIISCLYSLSFSPLLAAPHPPSSSPVSTGRPQPRRWWICGRNVSRAADTMMYLHWPSRPPPHPLPKDFLGPNAQTRRQQNRKRAPRFAHWFSPRGILEIAHLTFRPNGGGRGGPRPTLSRLLCGSRKLPVTHLNTRWCTRLCKRPHSSGIIQVSKVLLMPP